MPPVDPNAERAAFLADLPPLLPPPVAQVIGITDETAQIAERITETRENRAAREMREVEARQDQIDEENRYLNEITKKISAAMRGRG